MQSLRFVPPCNDSGTIGYDFTHMNLLIRKAVPEDAEALLENVRRLTEEPMRNIALGPGEFAMTLEEERKFLSDIAASPNSSNRRLPKKRHWSGRGVSR